MIFNKSTYNLILVSVFALLLSACAQQAKKLDPKYRVMFIQEQIQLNI